MEMGIAMSKTILVTGAAGFVGSHLCERLINEGHHVKGLDNYYTGAKANISHLMDSGSFEMRRHDVAKPYWEQADEVYNLACPASPVHYQSSPIDTMRTSFLGAMHALEVASASNAKVLQASTSEVYGDPSVHPQPEDYWGNVNPYGERACYDEGKRSAEALFYSFRQERPLETKIARIFNTYGPRMQINDGRVVSNFIVQALNGEDITIYGEGNQTRSFCYVDDLVEGLIRLMRSTPEQGRDPINLGNPGEFTILELAEQVIEMTGSASKLVFMPLPADDPQQRKPDIRRATVNLGWEPKVSLKVGLEKTIDYFDHALSIAGHISKPARVPSVAAGAQISLAG